MSNEPQTLDDVIETYCDDENLLLDVDLIAYQAEYGKRTPNIIVRAGEHAVMINLIVVPDSQRAGHTYLDVDVHPFVNGVEATADVIGWEPRMHNREDQRGKRLVAVLVGNTRPEED